MGARKKGDEGVRVPELEQRELEDGTRFCQVSERSALAPTVRNTEEGSRCERGKLSRKEHFLKAWKSERTERFLRCVEMTSTDAPV
jgi:hypothetical protein